MSTNRYWRLLCVMGFACAALAQSPGPQLINVSPANESLDVSPISPVVFTFDRPMDPAGVHVEWSPDPGHLRFNGFIPVSYWWADNYRKLYCHGGPAGFPAGEVRWWLRSSSGKADGFRDSFAAPLMPDTVSGSVTFRALTAGGCLGAPTEHPSAFSGGKSSSHRQSAAGLPLPDLPGSYRFAVYSAWDFGDPPPRLTLKVPASSNNAGTNTLVLDPDGTQSDSIAIERIYDSQQELEANYPEGAYELKLQDSHWAETNQIRWALPSLGSFPAPKFRLHPSMVMADVAHPVVIQFETITSLSPDAMLQFVLRRPSERQLRPDHYADTVCTSISDLSRFEAIVLPPGTLAPGQEYEMSLYLYQRHADFTVNGRDAAFGTAKGTAMPLLTGESPPAAEPPMLHLWQSQLVGICTPGTVLRLQRSTNSPDSGWSTLEERISLSRVVDFFIPTTPDTAFFRILSP